MRNNGKDEAHNLHEAWSSVSSSAHAGPEPGIPITATYVLWDLQHLKVSAAPHKHAKTKLPGSYFPAKYHQELLPDPKNC